MTKPILDENTDISDINFNNDFIYENNILTESFIEKNQGKVNWQYISARQELSENLIEKFKNKVNWGLISFYQKLSESFIEKHQDKVDWKYISLYQKLSSIFIAKFYNKLYFNALKKNKSVDQNFIKKIEFYSSNKKDFERIINEELAKEFEKEEVKVCCCYNLQQQLSSVETNLLNVISDLSLKISKLEEKLNESKSNNQTKTSF